jgi:hypothetical protein
MNKIAAGTLALALTTGIAQPRAPPLENAPARAARAAAPQVDWTNGAA